MELNEGPRVDARIEGVDTNAPETIKIGTPLKVKFLHRRDGENLKTYLALTSCVQPIAGQLLVSLLFGC